MRLEGARRSSRREQTGGRVFPLFSLFLSSSDFELGLTCFSRDRNEAFIAAGSPEHGSGRPGVA